MLSTSDRKRLEYGATAKLIPISVALLAINALIFGTGAARDILMASNLAAQAQMSLWEVATFEPQLTQEYSGAVVKAVGCLSSVAWEAAYSLFFATFAIGLRTRARFFQRMLAAVDAKGA